MTDTANAPERDDELLPCPFCGGEARYNIDHTTELCNSVWCRDCDFGVFDPNGTGSSVAAWNRRTHCDELVAAAYLNAAQRIEQCLWSQHWYIDGESVDPEDLSEDITKRTPDDARAALTAYGERMKADLAEAQAKDAPVRHWVRRYYHQDDGNGFGAITGSEWVEVYPPERRTDFRDALIKELVATVDWYADQFCEGLCRDIPLSFTTLEMERDCGGCRARAALGKAKEAGYDAE